MKKITFYLLLIILTALSSSVMGATTNADSVRAIRGIRGKMIQSDSLIIAKRDSTKVLSCDSGSLRTFNEVVVPQTLQTRTNTGTDLLVDSLYTAFRIVPDSTVNVFEIGIQIKRTGTMASNVNFLSMWISKDSIEPVGGQIRPNDHTLTGVSNSKFCRTTVPTTSYTEYRCILGSVAITFTGGTGYWIVLQFNPAIPTGGTISINCTNTGVGAVAKAQGNHDSWTTYDNFSPSYTLYKQTSICQIKTGGSNGIAVSVSSARAIGCFVSATQLNSPAMQILHVSGGDGINITSAHGTGVRSTTTDGHDFYASSALASSYFAGSLQVRDSTTTYGNAVGVKGGIHCDSLSLSSTFRSSDSSTTSPATGTPMTATSYFGTNGAILTTPDAWMNIQMKGSGGTYQTYRFPLYK